jgi:hypothetical protein
MAVSERNAFFAEKTMPARRLSNRDDEHGAAIPAIKQRLRGGIITVTSLSDPKNRR